MIDVELYLRTTYWCDVEHPAVRELAAELTRNARTPYQAAAALFDWVRGIALAFVPVSRRASETIELGVGTRANQANAVVALARAIGIPAAFRVRRLPKATGTCDAEKSASNRDQGGDPGRRASAPPSRGWPSLLEVSPSVP